MYYNNKINKKIYNKIFGQHKSILKRNVFHNEIKKYILGN